MDALFKCILFITFVTHLTLAISTNGRNIIAREGETAVLPFNTSWPSAFSSNAAPYFTLRHELKRRPFCIDGFIDPQGFIHRSQNGRFKVVPQRYFDSLAVNLFIHDVNIQDEGSYVFSFLLYGSDGRFDTDQVIELEVIIPPGKAECSISANHQEVWKEVHCRATAGTLLNTTLYCFQDNFKAPYKREIYRNGELLHGVFWKISSNPIHCCSHEWKYDVTQDACDDFVFPPNMTRTTTDNPKSSKESPTLYNRGARTTEHVDAISNRAFTMFTMRECKLDLALSFFLIMYLFLIYESVTGL